MEQTELEKKAEEYIRTDGTNGEKVWEKIHKEFPNCIVVKSTKSKKRLSELLFEYTKTVYLDGLAEGRKEKWHEIQSKVTPKREISKKYMPKPREKVFLKYHFYNDTEIHYSDGYYDNYDFEFHIPSNPIGRVICVIAWCELP